MLEKRLIAMAGACLLAFAVVVCALAAVSTNPAYAAAAVQQSSTSVVLSEGRGNIYDLSLIHIFVPGAKVTTPMPTPEVVSIFR